MQVNPDSIRQVVEHPSPGVRLPSSHFSELEDSYLAFPHNQVQFDLSPSALTQDQPDSTVQVAEQPSPVDKLPSSHTSQFED